MSTFFAMADLRLKLAEPLPDAIPAKKPNPFAKGATIASLPPRRKSSKLLNAAAIEAARSKKVRFSYPDAFNFRLHRLKQSSNVNGRKIVLPNL